MKFQIIDQNLIYPGLGQELPNKDKLFYCKHRSHFPIKRGDKKTAFIPPLFFKSGQ